MTPDMIPLILAKRSDACLWEMGDYLIKVAGESDDKRARNVIREVSDELIAHGHAQYTVAYLNRLHRTACALQSDIDGLICRGRSTPPRARRSRFRR